MSDFMHFFQIIEEQLAFPSGTATAHLISVLHKLPPPDTSVRRREVYHHDDDDEEEERNISSEAPIIAEETPEQDATEGEIVENQGWHNLLWSFAASAFLTVSFVFHTYWKMKNFRLVVCLLFPCYFRNPSVRQLFSTKLAVVFQPKFVICWPRFVSQD